METRENEAAWRVRAPPAETTDVRADLMHAFTSKGYRPIRPRYCGTHARATADSTSPLCSESCRLDSRVCPVDMSTESETGKLGYWPSCALCSHDR